MGLVYALEILGFYLLELAPSVALDVCTVGVGLLQVLCLLSSSIPIAMAEEREG